MLITVGGAFDVEGVHCCSKQTTTCFTVLSGPDTDIDLMQASGVDYLTVVVILKLFAVNKK
jgi:hypothetical protein